MLRVLVSLLILITSASVTTSTEAEERSGLLRKLFSGERTAKEAPMPGETAGEITVGGTQRSYLLYKPPAYDPAVPVPLVMAFHGGHGEGRKMSSHSRLNELAAREGFLVVYPDATGSRHWNDGRSTTADGADDVSFIRALIVHLERKENIDLRRIYATGLSNGGFFTQRLACEMSDIFAAFATVAATMGEPLPNQCKPTNPVAILMINGTEDGLVPWQGGKAKKGGRMGKGGAITSVDVMVNFWVEWNSCNHGKTVSKLPERDEEDGTHVERWDFDGCAAGSDVVLLKIVGGGHTWPGAPKREGLVGRIVGTTSREINANQIIWEFFEQYEHMSK